MRHLSGPCRAVALAVAAVVALVVGVIGVPVAPAGAGTVTQTNACTWFAGGQVPMDITVSGSGSPANPAYLAPMTLSGVTVSGVLPWWAATVAYESGLINEGPNMIPIAVRLTIEASNAQPASQDVVAYATMSVTYDDAKPFTEAGQAGQLIKVTNVAMPSSTWTRTGQFAMSLRQGALTVRTNPGAPGSQQVLRDCFPASWSTDDVPVATPVTPSPFAKVGSTLPDPTFSDVPYGHPFFLDIEWAAAQGIAGGYPDGSYRPATAVSRQAFAAFLYRAAGEPPFVVPARPSFPDVPKAHPFFKQVEWAKAAGIIGGYDDGRFKPAAPVSRQAAAQWLLLASGTAAAPPSEAPFPDVPLGHPFVTAVAWLDQAGIASGYPDGTFRPGATVTRQAAAAWFSRAAT